MLKALEKELINNVMVIRFWLIAAIDASDAKTNETSSSVDSQIKDSSNSFRRRHSSEGVDAKFSSTLPKDSAVSDSLDKNKYLDTAEIWSY